MAHIFSPVSPVPAFTHRDLFSQPETIQLDTEPAALSSCFRVTGDTGVQGYRQLKNFMTSWRLFCEAIHSGVAPRVLALV